MRELTWRVVSYLGFLGVFTYLYGRTGTTVAHGRRGLTIFALEVIALVVADIVRVATGLGPLTVFGPTLLVLSGVKIVIIVKAITATGIPRSSLAA